MNSWNKFSPCVRIFEDSYVLSRLFLPGLAQSPSAPTEEGLRRRRLSLQQFPGSATRCPVFYKVYAAFNITGTLKYRKGFQQVSICIIHVFTSPPNVTVAIFEKFSGKSGLTKIPTAAGTANVDLTKHGNPSLSLYSAELLVITWF